MTLKDFHVRGKKIELPIFLPDATHGYVRGISTRDLVDSGIKGIVVNAYHLFRDNLVEDIKKKGGIEKYMKLPYDNKMLTLSDSGGFQVFSIIHNIPSLKLNRKLSETTPKPSILNRPPPDKSKIDGYCDSKNIFGYLDDNGATFIFEGRKIELTPEKCIQIQIDIGADIIMCLDDCTSPEMGLEEQNVSVRRTIAWAERCKNEYLKLTRGMKDSERPLIFGIIQGGKNLELRKRCADELIKIGFDGYAFGGWPAEGGKFLHELLKYTAELMPDDKPKYAMGIGKPEDIVNCTCMGYNLFDCVIPTREARNNRLYAFKSSFLKLKRKSTPHPTTITPTIPQLHSQYKSQNSLVRLFANHLRKLLLQFFDFERAIKKPTGKSNFYRYVRVRNANYKDDKKPISRHCSGICCRKYFKSDIYKLFREKNKESIRLATMHNLGFYSMLMEMLREK